MKNLTIIGHYCATGGISIHIRRLSKLLTENFNIKLIDESRLEDSDGETFNLRNKDLFGYLKIIRKSNIIHVHSSVPILRFFHILIGRLFFKKVVLTIHSLSTVTTSYGLYFLKFTALISNRVIVVSEELKAKLKLKKCIIVPAFIPPIIEDEPDLPEELNLLVQKQKIENKKLIVSNAYRLNLHNEQDLYGLDLIIDAAQKAKDENLDIFFLFVLTTLEINESLFLQYQERIRQNQLDNYIYIHTKSISFIKLIIESDLVIRATNTDGDAITIREAIYLGKTIIASDVVIRPEETVLFKNRDSNDLFDKIKESLNKSESPVKIEKEDFEQIYLNVFLK
jgi:glycosyltransferase involved in cell wall biosynthesis